MKVMTIAGGELFENCYFAMDDTTGQVAVIDPGFWNQRLEDVMSDLSLWYNMTIFYSTAETK